MVFRLWNLKNDGSLTYRMSHRYWANPFPYSATWTRTRNPGPVLGNLEPYSGTCTRTRESGPVLGNLDLNRSLVWDRYSGTWTRT